MAERKGAELSKLYLEIDDSMFSTENSNTGYIRCNLRRTAATGAFASGHPAEPNGHLH